MTYTSSEKIIEMARQYTKPGEYIVDIGVHRGQELFSFAEHVGSQGHVWGFEANPYLADLLKN